MNSSNGDNSQLSDAEFIAEGEALAREGEALLREADSLLRKIRWYVASVITLFLIIVVSFFYSISDKSGKVDIPDLSVVEAVEGSLVADWVLSDVPASVMVSTREFAKNAVHDFDDGDSFAATLFVSASDISGLEGLPNFEYSADGKDFVAGTHPYIHIDDVCDGSEVFEVDGHFSDGDWFVTIVFGKPLKDFENG